MQNVKWGVAGLVLALLVSGCSLFWGDPRDVAQAFWQALQTDDVETARSHATAASRDRLLAEDFKQEPFSIRLKVLTEDPDTNEVVIETVLSTNRRGEQVSIPLNTVLVREDGAWRVDVNRTLDSPLGAALDQTLRSLGRELGEMGRRLGESLQQELKALGEGLAPATPPAAPDGAEESGGPHPITY